MPNSNEYETSNNGNIARKFFLNADLTSEIIDIDSYILKGIHVSLWILWVRYSMQIEEC